MSLDKAHAAIDHIINRARAQLHAHREAGGTDEDFVTQLVNAFLTESAKHPDSAGVIHMAVSVYRMIIQQEEIWKLNDAVEMRDAALKTLWEIEEL